MRIKCSCWFEEYKPMVAMVVVQFIYAAMAISSKAAFADGMSPFVFVVYRQAIATLFLAPITIIARRGSARQMALGLRGFGLVFIASLIGCTLNQCLYYEGVNLSNASMATAATNLIPAITFVMAASIGLETVKMGSKRSMAKVLGTIICVGGAFFMAFFKGPKLLTSHSVSSNEWMIGCLLLIASTCCWSVWLILQVPLCERYLDPLSLTVWMCFLATIQSFVVTLIFEPHVSSWKITSVVEILSCLFAGIFGSGITIYLQSWVIAVRGPLFSAMFNPLNTIIATILSIPLLHEKLYMGSVIGSVTVIVGLYIVLWGKAKDIEIARSDDGDEMNGSLLESLMIKRHSSYSLI